MYKTIFLIIVLFILTQKEKKYNSNIPKIIFQTSKEKIPKYVQKIIKQKTTGWKYIYFSDQNIIKYLKKNPLEEFPDIIDKFNYFDNGAHKADLFRYYYLYINGGVFIDSDAIFEKNIEFIIKDYDFVSVKSIVPDTLFNGFIATTKKNPIIYNALKLLYKTSNKKLKKNYHLVCKQFLNVYEKYKNKNSILLYEYHDRRLDNICVKTYDNWNRHVITHFSWCKKIPKNFDYRSKFYCDN
tara:strand:+ start:1412 stop:2131 length:720 start_codon:yes stop_codon:yes gene_type:complete